jgi:hypothetical protein
MAGFTNVAYWPRTDINNATSLARLRLQQLISGLLKREKDCGIPIEAIICLGILDTAADVTQ